MEKILLLIACAVALLCGCCEHEEVEPSAVVPTVVDTAWNDTTINY